MSTVMGSTWRQCLSYFGSWSLLCKKIRFSDSNALSDNPRFCKIVYSETGITRDEWALSEIFTVEF